jgi:CMP-N,N'-diacetyllegionaminic acid synthase
MKNIKPLANKALIQYSIETAKAFANKINLECTLALSTDDDAILEVAQKLGLKTEYKRPEALASDTAGKVETIAHLLEYEESKINQKYDYVLDLDVSSPLRTVNDLIEAFELIENDKAAYNLFSVSKANRNPYFNMVEQGQDGYYKLIKPLKGDVLSRQKAPLVYDLNASFYFYKRVFFELGFKSVLTAKAMIYEMKHICFDIDHQIDFEMMDFLISNSKLDFEL